jgi:hypothetical protein
MTPNVEAGVSTAVRELVQLREAMEGAAAYSESLMGWALLIMGGSIIALLQKSYLRPVEVWMRRMYWLFVVGWGFLAYSIYSGTRVQGAYLAVMFNLNPEREKAIPTINADLTEQVVSLRWGLLVFGLWLVVYLGWWILHKAGTTTETPQREVER